MRNRKERAVLVVSELAGNAILHAGGVLWLQISHDEHRTRVEVADASEVLPVPFHAGAMSGRGAAADRRVRKCVGRRLAPVGKGRVGRDRVNRGRHGSETSGRPALH